MLNVPINYLKTNQMKKLCLINVVVFLSLFSQCIMAQTLPVQPKALESMKQYVGMWQAIAGKDTIEQWDCLQFGAAFTVNVSRIIKGQKSPLYVNSVGYDKRDDKINIWAK